MRKITYLFLFFISLNLSAQDFTGEWFLYSITIDGETQRNTFSNDFTIIFIEDLDTNELSIEGHAICNDYGSGGSNVSISENNTIDIELGYITLLVCNSDEENQFESDYFSIFQYNSSAVFNYSLTDDNPGFNNRILEMTNEQGNTLTFGKEEMLENNPLTGEWFLFEISSHDYYVGNNDISQVISVVFSNDPNTVENNIIINGVCNTYLSSYLTPVYESSYTPIELEWTPLDCPSDSFDIDSHLFDLFNPQFTTTINFEIIDSGDETILEISQVEFGVGHAGILSYTGLFSKQQLLTIDDRFPETELKIFPNPVSDYLNISNNTQVNSYYSIISIDGKIIIDEKTMNTSQIDVSFLEHGIYFIKIRTEESDHVLKFIKK